MGECLGRRPRAFRSETIGEMNIGWSREGLDELASLRAYLAEDDPAAARRIVLHIIQSVERSLPDNAQTDEPDGCRAAANSSLQGHPISSLIGFSGRRSKFYVSTAELGGGLTAFERGQLICRWVWRLRRARERRV
jgi:hypothetical protein